MNNINSRIQFRRVCKLSNASPKVLYTLCAESPFHDSMGLGGVGCANSLGDTVWSQNYDWVSTTSKWTFFTRKPKHYG